MSTNPRRTRVLPSSTNLRLAALLLTLACLTTAQGCLHRSPLWSPDGEHVLVLAGADGEAIDQAASQIWLVDVSERQAVQLTPPESGIRFLCAVWLSNEEYLATTGIWKDDEITEGTTKLWRRKVGETDWRRLEAPPPSEHRSMFRLPVVFEHEGDQALAYDAGEERFVVISLASGKELKSWEYADLVGPGPGGGFLYAYENDDGDVELHAVTADLETRWTRLFSKLRKQIATRTGRKETSVVINQAATSHVPSRGDERGWVGVVVNFADVSWKNGFPGYYLKLDAKTGDLQDAVFGRGSSGKARSLDGIVRGLLAPDDKAKTPASLVSIGLRDAKQDVVKSYAGLPKMKLHGYSADVTGKRLAVSINGPGRKIEIHEADQKTVTIELK